jgi:hypothetical protein
MKSYIGKYLFDTVTLLYLMHPYFYKSHEMFFYKSYRNITHRLLLFSEQTLLYK